MNIADRTDIAVLACALASTLKRQEFNLDNPNVRAAVLAWIEVAEGLCGRRQRADKANHGPRLLRGL